MANGQDRRLGATILAVSTIVFLYYTVWAMIMPFVDEGHLLHEYFPPPEYAIRIPVVLLLFGLTVVFTFISMVMIKSNQRRLLLKKSG
ncbi:dolichyl-phosphate mannosyltransferase polypeptide 2 [Basidiobolus meristosporus CBS 931.73]|uniref:Dolichol phosphate-mannose biosynthesis regulatory protein n=1 Tax=Basidiobolus meristosporus CBS 931.73 TaxID=1314790 RepID=A0A1Y1Y829_9FUNG|nr:dolichyl-phosphate mannosyltransferase polypeptide 2 [Basidiobolus meristosporus CBS 931.73]|eukprot:ORX94180.1 dolichyl-phosphate mannosyltransferase polypeptide 2 [Basidiobolus meristosporus CBS 931.73]